MRQPHQTDNLLSWCILQCCCPALASDHRPRSLPHPSGSGRRPSSASAWRRPGEGRGYFWQTESWDSKNKHICWVMQFDRLLKLQLLSSSTSITYYFHTHNPGILLLVVYWAVHHLTVSPMLRDILSLLFTHESKIILSSKQEIQPQTDPFTISHHLQTWGLVVFLVEKSPKSRQKLLKPLLQHNTFFLCPLYAHCVPNMHTVLPAYG